MGVWMQLEDGSEVLREVGEEWTDEEGRRWKVQVSQRGRPFSEVVYEPPPPPRPPPPKPVCARPACNKEFTPYDGPGRPKKYCSARCRREAHNAQARAHRLRQRDRRETDEERIESLERVAAYWQAKVDRAEHESANCDGKGSVHLCCEQDGSVRFGVELRFIERLRADAEAIRERISVTRDA
jgi:hypothetical protein